MFKDFRKNQQFNGIIKAVSEKKTKNIDVFFRNFYWDIVAL